MSVAIASYLFPTHTHPSQGIFVKDEAEQLKSHLDISLFIPNRLSLPFTEKWGQTHQFLSSSVDTKSHFYLSFPGRAFPALTKSSLENSFKKFTKVFSGNIIHLHFLYPTGLVIPWLKKAGYKTVLTIHGSDWYETIKNDTLWNYISESLEACDHILAVGEPLANDIKRKFPKLVDRKITPIQHGIDTSFFKPPEHSHYSDNRIKILSVANMYPQKGVDILIEALHLLQTETSANFSATIIAAGGDEAFREKIKNLIDSFGLQKFITIKPGMNREQLLSEYQSHDLYVQPSRRETFGLAAAEAAASGLPVVANSVGGLKKIVTEEVGLLNFEITPDSLFKSIYNLIQSCKSYPADSIAQSIQTRFSIQNKSLLLKNIYRDLTQIPIK